jgi:3-oxoacyl-[acyl-carrier-protein] synthase II
MGLVTPLACGVEETWARLLAGKSGIGPITKFRVDDLPVRIGGIVPRGDGSDGSFNPEQWMDVKELRRVDDFIIYAMGAAQQAVTDSGWEPTTEEERCRTGVLIGSGIGGLDGIEQAAILIHEKGPRKLSPFFIPGRLINLASGYASIKFQYKGPNHSVVTACATGAHAIGDAARLIAYDDADLMLAGGAESAVCRLGMAGFAACRALSTAFNDTPERASRPYDKDRDGFVMGEGAGIVMLEELEHARARGAKIYGEISGYGLSGDAHHITAPAEDGDGGFRAMKMALKRAGLAPDAIDYVNAHGTSTMADGIELSAVERLLGDAADKVMMSSTKSSIGHLLGAAGAVEAIFCLLAMRDGIVPATLNLDNPSVESKIDLVPHTPKKHAVNVALSNSFGFGGTNAALIFTRVP